MNMRLGATDGNLSPWHGWRHIRHFQGTKIIRTRILVWLGVLKKWAISLAQQNKVLIALSADFALVFSIFFWAFS